MTNQDSIRDDLAYVSQSINRNRAAPDVPAIYLLWAVLIPLGFIAADVMPQHAGLFWLIAGPGGGLISWWLGARHERRHGQIDKALGMRYGMHWLVGGLGFLGAFLPAMFGVVPWELAATNLLLVAALVYGLAAVHLDRPLALPAAIMGAGYIALLTLDLPYVWSATGILIGAALLIAGIHAHRSQAAARAS